MKITCLPTLLWKWRNVPFHFYSISKDYKHRCDLHICGGEELSVKEENILIVVMRCSLMGGRDKMEYHVLNEGAGQGLYKCCHRCAAKGEYRQQ